MRREKKGERNKVTCISWQERNRDGIICIKSHEQDNQKTQRINHKLQIKKEKKRKGKESSTLSTSILHIFSIYIYVSNFLSFVIICRLTQQAILNHHTIPLEWAVMLGRTCLLRLLLYYFLLLFIFLCVHLCAIILNSLYSSTLYL